MLQKLMKDSSAMVNAIVSYIVALILILAVGVPVSQSVITSANLTGINATIVSFVPTFLVVGVLVLAASTTGLGGHA